MLFKKKGREKNFKSKTAPKGKNWTTDHQLLQKKMLQPQKSVTFIYVIQ